MSAPFPRLTEPASGWTRPIISRSSVDLPQPLGPIKAVVRPAAIVRSISCSTTVPAYDFETPFSSIIHTVPNNLIVSNQDLIFPCVERGEAARARDRVHPFTIKKIAVIKKKGLILTLREVVTFHRAPI